MPLCSPYLPNYTASLPQWRYQGITDLKSFIMFEYLFRYYNNNSIFSHTSSSLQLKLNILPFPVLLSELALSHFSTFSDDIILVEVLISVFTFYFSQWHMASIIIIFLRICISIHFDFSGSTAVIIHCIVLEGSDHFAVKSDHQTSDS